MSRISNERIKQQIEKVPQPIKDLLLSNESNGVDSIINDLAKKYNLSENGKALLSDEVGLVLLGFTKLDDFVGELNSRGIKPDVSNQLTEEMNVKVFTKIKDGLNSIVVSEKPNSEIQQKSTESPQISSVRDFDREGKEVAQSSREAVVKNEVTPEKLDINKVLKEIEEPTPNEKGALPGAYTAPKPAPAVNFHDDKAGTQMKSAFEKKLNQFYNVPKNNESGKTSSPPANLPKLVPSDSGTPAAEESVEAFPSEPPVEQKKDPYREIV